MTIAVTDYVGDVQRSEDEGYKAFEALVATRIKDSTVPLFTTDVKDLFETYLQSLPADRSQHYNCNCCRAFMEKYGGLVKIDEEGYMEPLLWTGGSPSDFPAFFQEAVTQLRRKVMAAKVDGVFYSDEKQWGLPQTLATDESYKKKGVKEWTHLAGENPNIWRKLTQTPYQATAEKSQDYILLRETLAKVNKTAAEQAVTILEAEAVNRPEKALENGCWYLELCQSLEGKGRKAVDNLVWRAVALAPPGFTHLKNNVIGTLISDLEAGLDFAAARARWNKKLHPLQYQRPQAPPSDGQIEAANKLVEKFGAEGSLARRFARFIDVTCFWGPKRLPGEEVKKGGAFDSLRKEEGPKTGGLELPPKLITWEKFRGEVLPNALEIEFKVNHDPNSYFAFTTAENPEAPPILQWDGLVDLPRNPISWYLYNGGSYPSQWGLTIGWVKVKGIARTPCHWQKPDNFSHQGDGVYFLLEGAKDSATGQGLGIFPETLKAEYRAIRHSIEAFSRKGKLGGQEEADACGVCFQKMSHIQYDFVIRVKTKDGLFSYKIDRWD